MRAVGVHALACPQDKLKLELQRDLNFMANVETNFNLTAAPEQKSAGAPALTVRHLSVSFGGNPVLKNTSLDIAARAVTAIIGPSGCGKSTFLRAINRMHELTPEARVEGEIRLFGEDIYTRAIEAV